VEDLDFVLIDRTFSTQDVVAGTLFQQVMAAQLQLMAARGASIDWGIGSILICERKVWMTLGWRVISLSGLAARMGRA
jgi:hypothetical protein